MDDAAIVKLFNTAWGSFQSCKSFWILGHSFDTLLDGMEALPPVLTIDPDWGKIALHKATTGTGEAWYDDDCWWVIASLRTFRLPDWLNWNDQLEGFQTFCRDTWTRHNTYAPKIWDPFCQAVSPQDRADLRPKRDGGVWNSGWKVPGVPVPAGQEFWEKSSSGKPPEPWNLQADKLGGFQNAVTNGLSLVSAQRFLLNGLYTFGADNIQRAKDEFGFLQAWFQDDEAPMLNSKDEKTPGMHPQLGAMARERVGRYFDHKPVVGYDADLAWTGDQGIMLGALVDRMLLLTVEGRKELPVTPERELSDEYVFARDTALSILGGIQSPPGGSNALTFTDADGRLLNWTTSSESGPGSLQAAYCTGVGVFMRYFRYAYRHSVEVREYCKTQQPGTSRSLNDWVKWMATSASGMVEPFDITSPPANDYQKQYTYPYTAQVSYDVAALAIALAAREIEKFGD